MSDNRGFTIIEIMFALSIFAIGILAVSGLSITSVGSNASSRRITEATARAEDRLERLTQVALGVPGRDHHRQRPPSHGRSLTAGRISAVFRDPWLAWRAIG